MWRRLITWLLLACELATFVVLFGMLSLAGISAGFYWWPMPVTLGVGLLFAAGCSFASRKLNRPERWIASVSAAAPALLFSFIIAHDSWNMQHPVREAWLIPAGYQGPLYAVRGVPNGVKATSGKDRLVFRFDTHGIAMISEPVESRWKRISYAYLLPNGAQQVISEAVSGIDDTASNRADETVRIYFAGAGEAEGNTTCSYQFENAFVESPHYALTSRSFGADLASELQQLYPGMCTTRGSK